MLSEFDIYCFFRKEQSIFLNRPYRLPKNWDKHFSKLSNKNKEMLTRITKYFNTKWSNIDPLLYFECGFSLFKKSFSYVKFLDEKIIKLYITRDKIKKRENIAVKNDMQNSIKFVRNYLNDTNNKLCILLTNYGKLKNGNISVAVEHYIENKIGKFFLVYLIMKGYITVNKFELNKLPYITASISTLKSHVKKFILSKENVQK